MHADLIRTFVTDPKILPTTIGVFGDWGGGKTSIACRSSLPALRYGRYYFRQVSGDGGHFGFSMERGGVFAMSRVFADDEVLVVARPNPLEDWSGSVEVDADQSPAGTKWRVAFSTLGNGGAATAFAFAQPGRRSAIPVSLRFNEPQVWTRG